MKWIRAPRKMRGQSLVEAIIVLPLFALLIFGVMEISYLLHAKSTLNAATFDAARKGSLNNARLGAMNDGLAGVMAAMFVRSAPDVSKANAAKLKVLGLLNIPASPRGWIEIISPSKTVFNRFKKKQLVKSSSSTKESYVDIIPNDNLMWRDTKTQTIKVSSQTLNVNIQDANLLKIRAVWCHKLLVPILDRFIHWTHTLTEAVPQIPTSEQVRCDAHAKLAGDDGFYVPVTSSAIVRMQTPVFGNDLK
jgi:hypothetical protein